MDKHAESMLMHVLSTMTLDQLKTIDRGDRQWKKDGIDILKWYVLRLTEYYVSGNINCIEENCWDELEELNRLGYNITHPNPNYKELY